MTTKVGLGLLLSVEISSNRVVEANPPFLCRASFIDNNNFSRNFSSTSVTRPLAAIAARRSEFARQIWALRREHGTDRIGEVPFRKMSRASKIHLPARQGGRCKWQV
jgi:hypothetical protein